MQGHRLPAQFLQDGDRSLYGAAQHLGPARVKGRDQFAVMGKFRRKLGHPFGERLAGVELAVPGGRADLGEEAAGAFLVRQELAIEIKGIPVDQHATEIEYHRLDRVCHRHLHPPACALSCMMLRLYASSCRNTTPFYAAFAACCLISRLAYPYRTRIQESDPI